jgi:hypothetical protein
MKITEKEFNILTGETIITERDETATEQSTRETHQAAEAARQTEAQAKATAKAALLAQLGITEEQAKLLLS